MPYFTKDPQRDRNFDNHPSSEEIMVRSARISYLLQDGCGFRAGIRWVCLQIGGPIHQIHAGIWSLGKPSLPRSTGTIRLLGAIRAHPGQLEEISILEDRYPPPN